MPVSASSYRLAATQKDSAQPILRNDLYPINCRIRDSSAQDLAGIPGSGLRDRKQKPGRLLLPLSGIAPGPVRELSHRASGGSRTFPEEMGVFPERFPKSSRRNRGFSRTTPEETPKKWGVFPKKPRTKPEGFPNALRTLPGAVLELSATGPESRSKRSARGLAEQEVQRIIFYA